LSVAEEWLKNGTAFPQQPLTKCSDPVNFPKITVSLAGALIVLGGAACAQKDWIDQMLVTVDVTGAWGGDVHSTIGPGGGDLELTLEQTGAQVVGMSRVSGGGATFTLGSIKGTIRGDTLILEDRRGAFTGQLQVSGDDMSGPGSVSGWGPVKITLHRR